MERLFSTTIKNDLKELSNLMTNLNEFLKLHELTSKIANAVNLVLEESLINIIKYGYEGSESHEIDVHIEVDSTEVALRLEDDGKAFNPLTVPRVDKSKPAMERIEDGLGIHLVRNIMRSMSYRRKEEKNIFEIWIKR